MYKIDKQHRQIHKNGRSDNTHKQMLMPDITIALRKAKDTTKLQNATSNTNYTNTKTQNEYEYDLFLRSLPP